MWGNEVFGIRPWFAQHCGCTEGANGKFDVKCILPTKNWHYHMLAGRCDNWNSCRLLKGMEDGTAASGNTWAFSCKGKMRMTPIPTLRRVPRRNNNMCLHEVFLKNVHGSFCSSRPQTGDRAGVP